MSTYELSFDYLLLVKYRNQNTYQDLSRHATFDSAYKHAHIAFRHADIEAVQVIHIYSPYYSSLLLDLQDESDFDPEGLTPFYTELNPEHTEIAEEPGEYETNRYFWSCECKYTARCYEYIHSFLDDMCPFCGVHRIDAPQAFEVEVRRLYKQITKNNEIAEPSPVYQALLFQDDDLAPYKTQVRKIDRTLNKINDLKNELNDILYSRPSERPKIMSHHDAAEILSPFIGYLDHEQFWVIDLDNRNRVMKLVLLYKGCINSQPIRVAEVFRQAIIDNNPAIIIAHNHPSGDPTPSPEDTAVTRNIYRAGHELDIELLDHIIIAWENFYSFKSCLSSAFKLER